MLWQMATMIAALCRRKSSRASAPALPASRFTAAIPGS
jgi:hypothetical protein